MTSKNVIADLKLDGAYFDIWHRKIQYLLNDQGILDTVTIYKAQSKEVSTKSRQMQAYKKWKKERSNCSLHKMISLANLR